MVLSEAEAENRLAALRREREALDRAITDLTLYLELGRRLTRNAAPPDRAGRDARPSDAAPSSAPHSSGQVPAAAPGPEGTHEAFGSVARPVGTAARSPVDRAAAAGSSVAGTDSGAGELPYGTREAKSAPTGLSEGALARRYGRALVREALAVLEAAERPLHASEILAALTARGFTVPGQQDPVAALNTRLWKRAAPGGPLRRLGDAIYAPAEGGAERPDGEA